MRRLNPYHELSATLLIAFLFVLFGLFADQKIFTSKRTASDAVPANSDQNNPVHSFARSAQPRPQLNSQPVSTAPVRKPNSTFSLAQSAPSSSNSKTTLDKTRTVSNDRDADNFIAKRYDSLFNSEQAMNEKNQTKSNQANASFDTPQFDANQTQQVSPNAPGSEHKPKQSYARSSAMAQVSKSVPPKRKKSNPTVEKSSPVLSQAQMIHQLHNSNFRSSSRPTSAAQNRPSDQTALQEDVLKKREDEENVVQYEARSPYAYTLKVMPGLCLEEKYLHASDALVRVQNPPDYDAEKYQLADQQIQSLGFKGSLIVELSPEHFVLDKPGIDFVLYIPISKGLKKRSKADVFVHEPNQDHYTPLGKINSGSYGSGKIEYDLAIFNIASFDKIMIRDAIDLDTSMVEYCRNETMPFAGFGIDSIELVHHVEKLSNET